MESRSRAPVRGNYTLLLLVHWGKIGSGEKDRGTDCFNFSILPCATPGGIAVGLYSFLCLFRLFLPTSQLVLRVVGHGSSLLDIRLLLQLLGRNFWEKSVHFSLYRKSVDSEVVSFYNVYSAPGAGIAFSPVRRCDTAHCLFHYSVN